MRRRHEGFVLVLTLWVLAAIAIAAAYFGERVQASLQLAAARQDQTDAQIALSDGRAEMLYRLAVMPMSRYGFGNPPDVLRVDGRVYTDSGAEIQLQDAGGLINLNAVADDFLGRLLGSLEVPQEHQASLIDALRDYTDSDDLRRLNGAESDQYRAIGRPDLPRNAPLSTPMELRDVFGWAQETALWRTGKLLDFVTTEGDARFNPNTAPSEVLVVLPGVTPDVAQALMSRRELEPIGADWLDRALGTHFNTVPSRIATFPLRFIRVTQRLPGLHWALRYNVELTPTGATAPWRISSFYRLENLPPDPGPDKSSAARPASSLLSPAHAPDAPRFPPRPSEPASAPNFMAH